MTTATALALRVKYRALTLADIRGLTRNARSSTDPLSNLLSAAPNIREDERDAIRENIKAAWASGLNIGQIDLVDLAKTILRYSSKSGDRCFCAR